jgi:catechol 2,3-dioxygenase-like lactoylglutathione lyase family enzyme
MPRTKKSKKLAKTSAKSTRAKSAKAAAKSKPPAAKSAVLDFNHAMIYAKDVARSTAFYSGLLGLKLIDEFRHEGQPVYARLAARAGNGTIAIHQLSPGAPNASEGVRLYFEVEALDDVCAKLKAKGVYFTQLPRQMPWGWKHAYLDDPDNHEVSLYWAGANRMKKTVMRAGKEAAGKSR